MIELALRENSPLRYPGGKARRAVRLLRLADQSRKHYVEPFAGGLGLLFRARRERLFRSYLANDIDTDLVNFWTVLRDHPDDLIERLWSCYAQHGAGDEELFHRSQEDLHSADSITRAEAYFVVNKWSVKGDLAAGFIRTTKRRNGITPTMLARLPMYSELLSGVTLTCLDYRDVDMPRTAFVFADPPYERVGGRLYRKIADLTEFRDWTSQLAASWMATLNDSPYTNELFSDFDRIVEPVKYPVALNPDAQRFQSRNTTEIVIMNYRRSTRDAFLRRFGWSVRKAKRWSSRRKPAANASSKN